MQIGDAVSYFFTLIAIGLAPGPVILLLVTRAASNDVGGAVGFALGTALGSVTILTATCFGLAAWFTSYPEFLSYTKYVMLAYIIWIAAGIWRQGSATMIVAPATSGFGASVGVGFMTCVLSPYMLVLFPLVLPELLDLGQFVLPDFLIVTVLTFAAEATIALAAIAFALRLRRVARSATAASRFNRGLALLLALGGGWMALA